MDGWHGCRAPRDLCGASPRSGAAAEAAWTRQRLARLAAGLGWLLALGACGGGGGGAPAPTRPATALSGVVAGPLSGASVWLRALSGGEPAAQLSERAAGTDAEGRFSLSLAAPDQLVLVEATGGRFTEWASSRSVSLGPSDVLRAVAEFRSGEPLEITVSVLSHWIAACVASGRYGAASAASLSLCADASRAIFGVRGTQPPASPSDPLLAGAGWDNARLRHGFVLAGVSELMAAVSARNSVAPHRFYTSVRFADLLYRDMRADGVLDGQDRGGAVGLGVVEAGASLYRRELGLAVLSALSSPRNRTAASVAEALSDVRTLAESGHAVFGDAPVEALDSAGPTISPALPSGAQVNGVLSYAVRVSDLAGVERTEFRLGEAQDVLRGTRPVFTVNTATLPDGFHAIAVRAYDQLGNFTEREFALQVRNRGPAIALDVGDAHTRQARHVVSGTASGAVAVAEVTVNGRTARLGERGRFSGEAELAEGENLVVVRAVDALGNASTRSARVALDTRAPTFAFAESTAVFWDDGQAHQGPFGAGDDASNPRTLHMPVAAFDPPGALTPSELSAGRFAHYRFRVSDRGDAGDAPAYTPVGELKPEYRYRLGSGQTLDSDWLALAAHAELEAGEYVLALIRERMPEGWHNAAANAVHAVDFRVADRAGNIARSARRFRARFALHRIELRSQLAGADARAFAYRPGDALPGGALGRCRTDADGRCAIALLVEPQTIYLKVSGGALTEWASGREVRLAPAQGLLSLTDYPGGDAGYSNTVFSHLHAALAMKLAERDAAGAMAESARRFESVYGVEPVGAAFADVRERDAGADALTPPLRYGYLLAGVSEATLRLSRASQDPDHSRYHSYWFADAQWRDLRDDGRADGLDDAGPVSLGPVSAGVDTWRFALARGMVDYVQRADHALPFGPEDLLAAANALAGSRDPMFAGAPVVLVDIAPPGIDAEWPPGDALGGPVEIRFSLRDDNALALSAWLDGARWDIARSNGEASIALDTARLADGQHLLELEAVDAQGNARTWQRRFVVDNSPPRISVTERPAARWLSGEARFAFSIDDAQLRAVAIRVNGRLQASSGTLSTPTLTLDTARLDDGAHRLEVSAEDAAGNLAELSVALDVDNHPPRIRLSASRRPWHTGALTVSFAVVDAHLSTVTAFVDGALAAYIGTPGGGVLQLDSGALADGEHVVVVRAEDLARATASATWRFRSDNRPPVATLREIVAHRARAERIAGVAEFRFAVADVALAWVELRLDGALAGRFVADAAPRLRVDTAELADGEHRLELSCADQSGHLARLESPFVVDNTPPVVDAVVVPTAQPLSGTAQFAFVLIEAALAAVALEVDGVRLDHGERDDRPRVALDTTELADGWHRLTLFASDDLSQATSWSHSFLSDNRAPAIALRSISGSVAGASTPLLSGSVAFAFSVSDTSLADVKASLDGAELALSGDGAEPALTLDADALSSGVHELVLVATDGLGRQARYAYAFRTDDGAAPIVPLFSPAGFWVGGALNWSFRVADAVTGPLVATLDGQPLSDAATERVGQLVHLRLDTETLDDGAHRLELRAVDVFERAVAWRRDFGVDNHDPAIRFAPVDGPWSGVVDLAFGVDDASPSTLAASVDGSALELTRQGGSSAASLDTAALAEGVHTLQLVAVDAVGRSATVSQRFVSDNLAPVITPRFAALGRLHGAVSLGFSVDDPHLESVVAEVDGVAAGYAGTASAPTLELDTDGLTDSEHRLALRARDALGQVTEWGARVEVDNSPPEIDALAPARGAVLSGVETLAFVISDHALEAVALLLDGEPLRYSGDLHRVRFALDTTALADGAHALSVEARNAPGYHSVWQGEFVVDNHPPALRVVAAPSESGVLSGTVRFAFSVADASLRSTTLSVDGTPIAHDGGPESPSALVDTALLADGPHWFGVEAIDAYLRVATLRRRFGVDNHAPAIALASALESPLSGTARVAFEVSDASLASTTLSLDGRALATSGSPDAPSLALDTTVLADGEHRLRVLATDELGRASAWESTVVIDNEPPSIALDQDLAPTLSGVVSLSWTVRDATLAATMLSLDERALAPTGDRSNFSLRLDTAAIDEGSHRLSVIALDALGRSARWHRDFVADHGPPRLRLVSAPACCPLIGAGRFAWSVVDASPVSTTLRLNGRAIGHDGADASPSVSLDARALADGAHRLSAFAVDAAGQASSHSLTFHVDNSSPTIRLLAPVAEWLSGQALIEYRVSDASLAQVSLRLDGAALAHGGTDSAPHVLLDTVRYADGAHSLRLVASDRSGNRAVHTLGFGIDNGSPEVDVAVAQASSWRRGVVTATITAADASLRAVEITLDGAAVSSPTVRVAWRAERAELRIDTERLADGARRLAVRAVDALGRAAAAHVDLLVDNHAPSIEYALSGPEGERGWRHGAQTLSYSVRDVALRELTVFVDGREFASGLGADGALSLPTAALPDGVRRVRLRAVDAIGHESLAAFELPVDNAPPAIEPRVDDPGWRPESVSVFAGEKALRFELDNGAPGSQPLFARIRLRDAAGAESALAETLGAAQIGHRLNTATRADGVYWLIVEAEDGAGNRAEARYALRFDNSPPRAAALFETGPESPWRRGALELDFALIDASAASASLTANGQALEPTGGLPEDATATVRFALDSGAHEDGHLDLALRVSDSLGNTATAHYLVRVDNTPPSVLYRAVLAIAHPFSNQDSAYSIFGRVLSEAPKTVRVLARTSGPSRVPVAEDGTFDVHWLLPLCCQTYSIAIDVIDRAGNATEIREDFADADGAVKLVIGAASLQLP